MIDIGKRKDTAITACKEVGKILLDNFGRPLKVTSKGDRDLVSNIDKACEKAVIDLIKKHYPQDGILSEESPEVSSSSGFRWIIDPIDGTHNFICNIDIFGTSLALEFKGEVVLGAINMPCTNELYLAQKGRGAYCNGKKISVSGKKLKEATLIYDSSMRLKKKEMLNCLDALVDDVFNVRMFGSTVRSLTFIAQGKADIEIEFNDKVWDFAAGLLLVEEAGGKCTDFQGKPWTTNTRAYVASNGIVHEGLLKRMKRG
jgi:myo-inositol-1(or 4)-monophosphatase